MEKKKSFPSLKPAHLNASRTVMALCTAMTVLLAITGCQSLDSGTGFNRDCKYSVKYRKSYISCMPEGSSSPVVRPLPLKVDGISLENLFTSIGLSIGTAYRYGGTTPDGFDCSGFVQYLYQRSFRMLLPRTSGELAALGSVVPKNSLRPGDLVFFSAGGRIDHVGIFIGGDRFAHASINGVKISSFRERWYTEHYACAARVITTE